MPQTSDTASFDRLGHTFWDKRGPYRTLHDINPARLTLIERYIPLKGARILDIGCGGGILSEAMAARGAQVTGIDLSASVLDAARAHLTGQPYHIDYRQCDSATLVQEGQRWQHITCMEMLEHVVNPAAVLRDIAALLTPGGYAFLSTLNRTPQSGLGAIIAAEYLTRLVPRGTHHYDWFIKPAELCRSVEHAGLEVTALCGLDYHPLLRSAHLSRNLTINYFLVAHKPTR